MKTLLKLMLLVLLTACAPSATDQPESLPVDSYPNPSPPIPSSPNPSYPNPTAPSTADVTPAQQAALTLLSRTLSLPADQLTLVSTEAVTWSNGCLDVERPATMCTQAVVEGYRIIIEAGGKEYEVRTNETGSMAVVASGLEAGSLMASVLIRQLAQNLGLDEDSIAVVSNQAVEFSDACLGVVMQDIKCDQVVTSGRIIVLEADGISYEYHIRADGRLIQPATLALTWSRDGGIAGFCDRLTVFLSGEVYGSSCNSRIEGRTDTLAALLSPEEISQFRAWVSEYGNMTLDASDPMGVADRMSLKLTFYGRGSAKPLKNDEAALFDWAQTLYRKLYQ